MKAVIIDDEPGGRETLANFLRLYCKDVELVGEADGVSSGLHLLQNIKESPDIVFLDIQLKDGLSFQILDQLNKMDFEVVFATAFNQFAIKAFNYSAVGYLLKPIDPEELKAAVERVKNGRSPQMKKRLEVLSNHFNNPNTFEKMSISAVDGIYFINIKDIVRCEGEDNYTHIYLASGEKITVSKTIKEYEKLLSPVNFYRVHKSHVVNLNYMMKFVKGEGGYLIMEDGIMIEVSRRRRAAFMEKLRKLQ
jgi:two-component system LytT family response regulator